MPKNQVFGGSVWGEGMIKIAVCDDERFYRLRIKKLIADYFERKDIPCDIDIFWIWYSL